MHNNYPLHRYLTIGQEIRYPPNKGQVLSWETCLLPGRLPYDGKSSRAQKISAVELSFWILLETSLNFI